MSAFFYLILAIIIISFQTGVDRETKIKFASTILLFFISFLFLFLNFNPAVETFNNADKHVIATKAIEFNKYLDFYQSTNFQNNNDSIETNDKKDNDNSINGIGYGGFKIVKNGNNKLIQLQNFAKPLYLKNDNDTFILKNILGTTFTSSIQINFKNQNSLKLKINDAYPYYIVTLSTPSKTINYELDLITKKNIKSKKIAYGYGLGSFFLDNISINNLNNIEAEYYSLLRNLVNDIDGINLIREKKGSVNSNLALSGRFDPQKLNSIICDSNEFTDLANNYSFTLEDSISKISLSFNRLKPEDYSLIDLPKKNLLRLNYDYIKWFPLFSNKTKDEVRMFFTSNTNSVVKTVFNKGIYFNGNKNPKSATAFDASLNYTQNKSNIPLNIEILDHNISNSNENNPNILKVSAGKEFALSSKIDTTDNKFKVNRIFELVNVEKLSKFKPIIIYGIYFIFALLLSFLLFYKTKDTNSNEIFSRYLPPLASIIIVFITFKLFLLWRTSVFLPFSDLNDTIFNNLNKSTYLYRNTIVPFALFFIIALIRKFNLKPSFIFLNKLNNKLPNVNILFLCYLAMIFTFLFRFADLHILLPIADRFSAIYFPLLFYFISFYQILRKIEKQEIKNYFSLFNFSIFTLYFVYADTGFAIVFILFFLFAQLILNINSVFTNTNLSYYKINNKHFVLYLIALVFFLLVFTYFVSFVFNYFHYFLIAIAIVGILFMLYLSFINISLTNDFLNELLKIIPKINLSNKPNWANNLRLFFTGIFVVGCLLVAVFSKPISNKVVNDYVHIKYRAQTLTQSIKTIIEKEKFGTYNSRKIVETATNKWFLSYFLNKGQNIPFGFKKPYTLQKHFKHGVTYSTQSTDVMVARYLIGEHGWLSPLLLACLLAIGLVYLFKNTPNNYYDNKHTLKMIMANLGLAFILVIALFVNLTVTNKFIFFGQDFPILSIQSLVSPIIFFTVFAAIFFWFNPTEIIESTEQIKIESETTPKRNVSVRDIIRQSNASTNSNTNIRKMPHPGKQFNIHIYFIIGILFFAIPYLMYKNNYQDTFKLGYVFADVTKDFDDINNKIDAKQSNPNYVSKNLYDLFEDVQFDSTIEYSKTLFEKLKAQLKQAQTNNIYKINESKILGPLVLKMRQDKTIEIKIQNQFYDLPSPDAFEKQWKGSLVAKNINNSSTITDISNLDDVKTISCIAQTKLQPLNENAINIQIHVIPANWFHDEKYDVVVVDNNSGTQNINKSYFKILKANENVEHKSLISLATKLHNEDILSIEGKAVGSSELKTQFFYASENIKYFAKNIWINGDYKHFYPFNDQFVLAYNLVENLKSDVELEKSSNNIELGLDYNLYTSLQKIVDDNLQIAKKDVRGYSKYDTLLNLMNINVIVATGDGDIIAMNDAKFKNPNLYFNPNDPESIYKTRLKLLSNFNANDENLVFGNNNLLKLQTGPQSTIKPLMLTALTSGYKLDWESLIYQPANINLKIKDEIYKFLDATVNLDQSEPGSPCNIQDYLIRSRNTYNTLVTILGTYSVDDFEKKETNIFSQINPSKDEFPKFSYKGATHVFNYNKFKKEKGGYTFTNEESIFAKQLYINFNLRTDNDKTDDLQLLPFNNGKAAYSFITPYASSFFCIDRNNTNQGVSQVIAGAEPFNASPIKMVEMYGKLFSGNKDFTLHLGDYAEKKLKKNNSTNFNPFTIHTTWGGINNWYNFLGNQIFHSMNQATIKTEGTSDEINSMVKPNYPQYYFYGKTGTGGDAGKFKDEGGFKIRNRHYALVVSNKFLGQNITEEDLKNHKFLIFYFSNHNVNSNQYWSFKKQMIDAVMTSDYVKYYFNNKSNK